MSEAECGLATRGRGGTCGKMDSVRSFSKLVCLMLTTPFRLPVSIFLASLAPNSVLTVDLGRHGTGHGVGHFLNVHEGPHGIGVRIGRSHSVTSTSQSPDQVYCVAYNSTPLKPSMTVTNEPGYYEDGKYGIRIENVLLVKEAKTPNNFGDKGYLGFENVTMCVPCVLSVTAQTTN